MKFGDRNVGSRAPTADVTLERVERLDLAADDEPFYVSMRVKPQPLEFERPVTWLIPIRSTSVFTDCSTCPFGCFRVRRPEKYLRRW